jgi:hypothetical protein
MKDGAAAHEMRRLAGELRRLASDLATVAGSAFSLDVPGKATA